MATGKKLSKKRESVQNPGAPDVTIEVEGESFRLCFDFAALASAKMKLKQAGIQLNLLQAIDFSAIDVDTLPVLFFAASQKYQPELTWSRALEIVNLRTAVGVFGGLSAAYQASMTKQEKNPPRAAANS